MEKFYLPHWPNLVLLAESMEEKYWPLSSWKFVDQESSRFFHGFKTVFWVQGFFKVFTCFFKVQGFLQLKVFTRFVLLKSFIWSLNIVKTMSKTLNLEKNLNSAGQQTFRLWVIERMVFLWKEREKLFWTLYNWPARTRPNRWSLFSLMVSVRLYVHLENKNTLQRQGRGLVGTFN